LKRRCKRKNPWLRLLAFAAPQALILIPSILFGIAGHLSAIGFMTTGTLFLLRAVNHSEFSRPLLAAIIILAVCKALFRLGEQYLGHDGAFRLLARLREELFRAVDRLSPALPADSNRGDICAAVMADVEQVEVFFAHTISPVVIAFTVPAAVMVYTGFLWWGFPVILLPMYLALGLFFPVFSRRRTGDAGREYLNLRGRLHGFCIEVLQGMTDILSLDAMPRVVGRLKELSSTSDRCFRSMKRHEGRGMVLSEVITGVSAGILLLGGYFATRSVWCDIDGIIIGIVTAACSFGPVLALTAVSSNWLSTRAAAERIFELLDRETPVNDAGSDDPREGPVSWDTVGFSYGHGLPDILQDFTLSVQPGTFTILTGKSGCGKSTALHLLFRYRDPASGRVVVADRDIRSLRLDDHRRSMALLTQDTYLFQMSILENLRLADPDASPERVKEAAKRADIHEFIESLPSGYHTPVAELGSSLSSGKCQRLGLARMFLLDTPVRVFDEPTNRVDALSEARIIAALDAEKKNTTTIMVTHREYLFSRADNLVYMNNGRAR